MVVERIVGFLKGYVVICADGVFCERFLNICMHRGIFLRNVRRLGETRITASMSISAFREIRQIARKTRTKVSIISRKGLPFVLHRYRKRKALVVGIVVFAVILWYLATHVVGIDVVGNERLSTHEVIAGLRKFGVYQGAPIDEIDHVSVQNRMMTEFDEIAWIGINLKGSRLHIEIRERLDTKRRVDADVPCDIVAEKDGLVKLLEVKNGQTVVKVNQYVEEGDLLVSGVMDSQTQGMRFVHSFGEVYAETSYKKSCEYPFEYTEKIYTGKEKKRYRLSVLGKEVKLYLKGGQPFEYCDKEEGQKEYRPPISFVPSLFVNSEKYKEYTPVKKKRTVAEAVELGTTELSELLKTEVPQGAEILNKKVTHTETTKGVSVTVEFICREDIGSQRIIDKTEYLGYDIIEKE